MTQVARQTQREVERAARDPGGRMAELIEALGGVARARELLDELARGPAPAAPELAPAPTGPRMTAVEA